jgi:hypothetical protein
MLPVSSLSPSDWAALAHHSEVTCKVGRQADRLLLISPIISEEEKELAQSLGIEVYTDASKVLP